ncbi:MAG: sensor histidine kinase [Bauldia sp.]
MRLLPRTLAGQLVVLLLLALVVAQVLVFLTYSSERGTAVREADRSGLIDSAVSTLRVLRLAPPEMRAELAEAASSPRVRIWTSAESAVPNPSPRPDVWFTGRLPDAARIEVLRDTGGAVIRAPLPEAVPVAPAAPAAPRAPDGPAPVPEAPGASVRPGPVVVLPAAPAPARAPVIDRFIPFTNDSFDLLVSIPFPDGGWLNAQTQIRAEPVRGGWELIPAAALMAVLILLVVAFTVRRVTRPLRALAARADALGKGTPEPPVPEEGPDEVRRVMTAFNRMQERLGRFVSDRTRMIAAIGHDLRTPITSLRLRAELLDDDDTKQKMLATLEDMQRMVEATLAFARDEAAAEAPRSVDLAALIGTVVDDQADIGKDVVFAGAGRLPYVCRPTALKRAVNNLILNAVQYGEQARVSLEGTPGGPVIAIEDGGPGIPPERMEDVFQPFVRLENSRSRETGGVGLGLSIARSIVLAHGGELVLSNRREGGLRAEIRLPAGSSKGPASA